MNADLLSRSSRFDLHDVSPSVSRLSYSKFMSGHRIFGHITEYIRRKTATHAVTLQLSRIKVKGCSFTDSSIIITLINVFKQIRGLPMLRGRSTANHISEDVQKRKAGQKQLINNEESTNEVYFKSTSKNYVKEQTLLSV